MEILFSDSGHNKNLISLTVMVPLNRRHLLPMLKQTSNLQMVLLCVLHALRVTHLTFHFTINPLLSVNLHKSIP